MIQINFVELIKKWKKSHIRTILTASECAKILGCSGATLSKIESGKMNPGTEIYLAMCLMAKIDILEFADNIESLLDAVKRAKIRDISNKDYKIAVYAGKQKKSAI